MASLKKKAFEGILALGLLLGQRSAGAGSDLDGFMDKPVSFGHATASTPEPKPKAEPKAVAKPAPKPAPKPAAPVALSVSPSAKAEATPTTTAVVTPSAPPAASSSPAAAVVASLPFKLEGQLFLRYDHQVDQALSYGAPGTAAPKAVMGQSIGNTATASKGAIDALYVRRAEFKLTSDITPWAKLVLGWDLSESKLKDAGLEAKLGSAGRVQLGQFRQRFGVEPQLGSTKTYFPERALIYGGLHPFASGPAALVKERTMGLHGDWKPRFGPLGLELGGSLMNSATEDQGANVNKPGSTGAFPASTSDHGPSYTVRLGLDGKLPGFKRLAAGSSFERDPQSTVPSPSDPSQERVEELLGFDAALETGPLQLQAEWVASQRSSGTGSAPNGVWRGVDRRREGWYATACLDLLHPFFGANAPSVDLLLRDEAWVPVGAVNPTKFGAWTAGLRYKTGKQWQSSLNCTVYDIDGDSGALGGSELWVFQQVLTF